MDAGQEIKGRMGGGDSMMTWEQKLEACNALCECSLIMRKPGDWYVHHGIEISQSGLLLGAYGNGTTPEEAVMNHWDEITKLKPGEHLVIHAMGPNRQAVKWNGYMWQSVTEKLKETK